MNARIADENEETGAEEKLGNAGEVKRSRIREDRHHCGGVSVITKQGWSLCAG